ncbi:MAG: dephospho-CoA kinase [Zoogloeaceae bacterium]|jgi:dephospho-CoA kinase|nr:dephospho-CoA kinase [Zoogloeaceae bacterium]
MSEEVKSRVIGLTGGIGSGKSAAAGCFAALGAAVVDTDAIAHELTGPDGGAMASIEKAFGRPVIATDGRLDRAVMRRLAFEDPGVRQRLEDILHPLIRAQAEHRCQEALAGGAPYVILSVPLLVESDAYLSRVARVAVVDCDDEIRIARVAARSGLSREEILRIIDAQASRQARLAIADDVIDNGGSLDNLAKQVAELHRRYLAEITKISAIG